MKRDHAGDIRGYHHLGAAWYGSASLGKEREYVDSITIGLFSLEGGTSGEFIVVWERLAGRITPRLKAYDDSWSALNQFGDLLSEMAKVDSEDITPKQFCDLLKKCGIKDLTERVRK